MRHPFKRKSRLSKKPYHLTCSGFLFGLLWIVLVIGISWESIAGGPLPGQESLGPEGAMHIGADDRCPVCAMLPIRYPRFAAAIELQEGRTFYFCSPGCMLNAWRHPDIFLGATAAQLKRPIVLEYLSGQPLDARLILWVSGSDVVGPMGPALVPLKDKRHLDAFRQRHGAKHVFHLDELNDANWETLTGKRPPKR